MCGIVAYFGGAGNHLTRVLTGMSAIIYRAPDSTGVGLFGDASEPVRTRKCIGSVGDLIQALLSEPAYPDRAAHAAALWADGPAGGGLVARQQKLLGLEGFGEKIIARAADPAATPPSFDDLVNLERRRIPRLAPGDAGRAAPLPVYPIHSPKDLHACVHQLIYAYDLSPFVIQRILRQELQSVLADGPGGAGCPVAAEDVLRLFDQTMERMSTFESAAASALPLAGDSRQRQDIWDALWGAISRCPVVIPADYDRDGVRGVFRILDGALLARLANAPGLKERLDEQLRGLWPSAEAPVPLDWRHLYLLEKAANVFGRAASAALCFLQTESGLVRGGAGCLAQTAAFDPPVVPGTTDPVSLRFCATPILAHGRWALQSPVTVGNCHPFLDEHRQRAIAVNGQFDSELENRVKTYLRDVAGLRLRTQNSGEYFALLWGHYFRSLNQEQARYEAVRRQTELGLNDLGIGHQAIDYLVFHKVRGLSPEDLDELAFRSAAQVMSRNRGQIAVVGISLVSPRRVYVASHNRPVFIVRRPDNSDVMVVSDINAAIGLFPQRRVHPCIRQLLQSQDDLAAEIQSLVDQGALRGAVHDAKRRQLQREKEICARLPVAVYPLEGESRFARIEAVLGGGRVAREIRIADLDGVVDSEFDPRPTVLKPAYVSHHLKASFFEAHLEEVPERLEDIFHAYTEDQSGLPDLALNGKLLQRRFGRDFKRLRRLILAGCGSAYHAALMCRSIFQRGLPHLTTIVARPEEVYPEERFVSPERDLVVLVSWSSTTADMVELAASLARMNVVAVAITEKPFADMALMVAKSGGVMACLSGEEVTVSAVKSTFCLMSCLAVAAAWLARESGRTAAAVHIVKALATLPLQIRRLVADADLGAFCRQLVESKIGSTHCVVIHGADHAGIGLEAALKIEECGWVMPAMTMPFQDVDLRQTASRFKKGLILVDATSRAAHAAALGVMARLAEADLDFAVLTYACRESGRIKQWSGGRSYPVPKIEDAFQPFLDLVCHDRLAFQIGLAYGRAQSGFPRNRAKSVTVGRSRPARPPSPTAMLSQMAVELAGPPETCRPAGKTAGPPLWENQSRSDDERRYYRCIRSLVGPSDAVPTPAGGVLAGAMDIEAVTRLIFEDMVPDGHLVLAALDRSAEMAALNVAAQWGPLLPCGVRVERCGFSAGRICPNSLLLVCGTRPPDADRLTRLLHDAAGPRLWAGPDAARVHGHEFAGSIGGIPVVEAPEAAGDALYLALCRLLSQAWQVHHPQRGGVLSLALGILPALVDGLLGDGRLRSDIVRIVSQNRRYATSFYVGPPGGAGLFWEDAASRHGGMVTMGHRFGECAHGSLVTVDPRLDLKYVSMDNRAQMAADHGEAAVRQWEETYLDGRDVDAFLAASDIRPALAPAPLFGEGRWYLPELRNDYDAGQDNLIFLDATSRRHFSSALDELSTFSCRHARIVAIVRSSLERHPEAAALYGQPISHFLKIPEPDGQEAPAPDILMPIVRNLLGTAIAAESAFQPRSDGLPGTGFDRTPCPGDRGRPIRP